MGWRLGWVCAAAAAEEAGKTSALRLLTKRRKRLLCWMSRFSPDRYAAGT